MPAPRATLTPADDLQSGLPSISISAWYESSLLLHVCSLQCYNGRRLSVIDGVLKSRECIPVQHLAPRWLLALQL